MLDLLDCIYIVCIGWDQDFFDIVIIDVGGFWDSIGLVNQFVEGLKQCVIECMMGNIYVYQWVVLFIFGDICCVGEYGEGVICEW